MRTLIVVPTYNEIENVGPLSSQILEHVPAVEILFVDDSSPDGTSREIAKLAEADARIHLLQRPGKLGLGTAYLAGFRYAIENDYDVAVTMDADFSHHPRYLPALLDGMPANDLMIGSRYVPGGGVQNWGLHRRLLSRFANFYARTLLQLPPRDCTAGFRAYRVECLRRLPLDSIVSSGYSFLEEMIFLAHRHGLRIGETPIIFEDRLAGRSKISKKEIFLAAYHVLRLRFDARGARRAPPVAAGRARESTPS